LTLKLRVGKKGYILLPKAIRESVGINEGDEVVVEIGEGKMCLAPVVKGNATKLKKALEENRQRIRKRRSGKRLKPGELAGISLEGEFE
jgi:AbrB family looped-hinge helix DNA binding protein